MKTILLLFAFLALSGCGADPIATPKTNNPGLKVEVLGDADGCRIYRFSDGSVDGKYFVRCQSATFAMWPAPCGKNCTHQVSVQQVAQ